jgi:hypothetical protein
MKRGAIIVISLITFCVCKPFLSISIASEAEKFKCDDGTIVTLVFKGGDGRLTFSNNKTSEILKDNHPATGWAMSNKKYEIVAHPAINMETGKDGDGGITIFDNHTDRATECYPIK